ncbi:hypothetical protein K2X85_04330 [bacterium]|nr:hypothetical protein [bacterium]
MTTTYPPTIIIVHDRERREKCSVEPLRGRPDITFHRYPIRESIETTGYIKLALDGIPLSMDDAPRGLLLLDATWRLAAKMDQTFQNVEQRTLPAWKTAYPRQSKVSPDPMQGLATVEALYLAYRILNRPVDGLLAHYHWRDRFLELNEASPSFRSPVPSRDKWENPPPG